MADLNYEDMVNLDAESLAEAGLAEAYETIRPLLERYVERAEPIEEILVDDNASYSIKFRGGVYPIYSPGDEEESWGKATFALFDIVNAQLGAANVRFFAINGGNDLGGMFLTPEEVQAAQKDLPRRQDWPYLPTSASPWYGQPH